MTATDVATVTPTEAATEASTSKNASPVKEKTPEQIKEEAGALVAAGKRDLLLNNVPEAVSNLAQACELLSKQFGETASECAEVYFYYGKSLLELSRMESGVLGNALEGVPEEDSENNTSQFEDPAKLTDQEKDEVTDNVLEAIDENAKDLEEKKKAAETEKETEKKEDKKEDDKKESTEAEKKSSPSKSAEKPKEVTAEAKDGEAKKEGEDSAMEEDEEETGDEEDADESSDEKKEGEEEKKDEEEPSNLQLAWEMLELAKVVYTKQMEAETGDKAKLLLERLCSTMLALGEVSIENENYKQAVEDILECLKKTGNLAKDARIIAETHYQLGVAQGFHAEHDEAVKSLQSAISIIKERIENQKKLDTEEAKKEVKELEALIPEIEEKINDTKDMKKEAEAKKEEGVTTGGDAFTGASKTAEVKPVSSIAVKRKAEDEESSNKKVAAETETAAAS